MVTLSDVVALRIHIGSFLSSSTSASDSRRADLLRRLHEELDAGKSRKVQKMADNKYAKKTY